VGLGAALDEAKLAAATWAPPGRTRHLVPSQPTSSYSVIRFGFGSEANSVSWSRIDLVRASRITLSPKSTTSRSRIRVSGCTRSSSRRGWDTPRPGTVASCAPKVRVRDMDVPGNGCGGRPKNVTQFQTGDEVLGTCDGSFAVRIRAQRHGRAQTRGPDRRARGGTHPAFALPGTARRRHIKSGQRVLIVESSGGVGLFALQMSFAGVARLGLSNGRQIDAETGTTCRDRWGGKGSQ
jgi:hypothetical protein